MRFATCKCGHSRAEHETHPNEHCYKCDCAAFISTRNNKSRHQLHEPLLLLPLKVWGGSWDGRSRGIVAARTKIRAVELLAAHGHPMSRHYFDGYWSESGNEVELKLAMREGVWFCKTPYAAHRYYQRVPLKAA